VGRPPRAGFAGDHSTGPAGRWKGTIVSNADDLFGYADNCVNNKGVLARIGHSAKLHALRSAISSKGSAASKAGALVGVAVRSALSYVPVPVVNNLLVAAEKAVEAKVRKSQHKKNLGAAGNLEQQVKFQLKELKVEDLDRYRWKVSEAIESLNKLMTNFGQDVRAKQAEGATCDAYLELAMAAQQVRRRLLILKKAVLSLKTAAEMTEDWIVECEAGVRADASTKPASGGRKAAAPASVIAQFDKIRDAIAGHINDQIRAAEDYVRVQPGSRTPQQQDEAKQTYLLTFHGKCDRWCSMRAAGKPDDWATFRTQAAAVVRTLASPMAWEDFTTGLDGDDKK
jgi:hypothetical protein